MVSMAFSRSLAGIVVNVVNESATAEASVVVNQVPASRVLEADYCGIRSGRAVDKLVTTGLDIEPSTLVSSPMLVECPLNLECRYLQEVELGDYRLVLGEIVEVHAVEEAFKTASNGEVGAFDPLVYLGGIREYWSLGERKALAYKDGLQLEDE